MKKELSAFCILVDSAVWQSLSTPIWMEWKRKSVENVADNLNKMTERCFSETAIPGSF